MCLQTSSYPDNLQGPKGGVPGALEPWNFCFGARSPTILLTGALILFWLWSPEPKDILRGARSPAFSSLIIRVPRLHWFLITAFLCLFVRVNGHKETECEEKTVHDTSIRGYLSLYWYATTYLGIEWKLCYNRPIRLTQCCTQFKSPGDKILCVLYLHYNVTFTFKWYGNFWNKTFYSQKVWIGYNIELAE